MHRNYNHMKTPKLITLAAAVAFTACSGGYRQNLDDPRALLLGRLDSYAQHKTVAYGHQDDLSYGHNWRVEDWMSDPLDRSDVKDVTGCYPMVAGFDLGGIEMGDESNLDGVPFGLIRKAALAHADRGGIITFSWHPRNPLTGGDAWDVSSDRVVNSILRGQTDFGLWLERLGDFLESLGPDVAFIFRPWHENLASWFWWGKDLCSAGEYQQLYQMTWLYLTEERGLGNIVWCYSPNGDCGAEAFMERYPGDKYVDMLGIDTYQFQNNKTFQEAGRDYITEVRASLDYLKDLCAQQGKIMCFSETGFEGIPDPSWWTEALYPAIMGYPLSYVLTWRNAHDRPAHYYAAWEGSPDAPDMKAFSEKESILFLKPLDK